MKIKDYTYQHPWIARIIGFIILFSTIFGSLWSFFEPLDPVGIKLFERTGIWGYIGLVILSLLLSAIAIVFFVEKPKRFLPKIETELKKNEIREPAFFRKRGPLWIDFESEYIFRREEVDEIINKLRKEPRQVVEGDKASGKSVLLKNIGFDLAKRSKFKVFYIDCKYDEDIIKTYLTEALKIDDAQTLIIMDDYHLQIDICEYFLKQYRNQDIRKTKVLIGTRPIDEERHLEIHDLKKTKISPEKASKNIICKYLKEQFSLSDKKIEDLSTSFEEYEGDLWYLSWALDAFRPDEGVTKTHSIYQEIRNWIEEVRAEDVFLPLSILNQFEIPLESRLLTDTEYGLGLEEQKIEDLIDKNEIFQVERKGSIWRKAITLPHSSLAELNLKTYRETALGENIKQRLTEVTGNSNFEDGFLLYYLIHSDLLYYIKTISMVFAERFIGIINQNRSNNDLKKKVREAIQHNIDNEEDLEKLEFYLYGYLHSGLETRFVIELVQELDYNKLSRRINETNDVGRISSFFGTTQGDFLKKLMGQIDLENLKSKVINDIWALSGIFGALANTDNAITRRMLDMVGIPHIEELFRKFEFHPTEPMGRCYGMIAAADDSLAHELSMIIKARLKEPWLIEDNIPKESPIEEVLRLIQGAAEMQSLYGSHYAVLDTLLGAVEEPLKEKIQEHVRYSVDMSDGEITEQEAREAVLESIKSSFWSWFGYWDGESFKRTLARFDITYP